MLHIQAVILIANRLQQLSLQRREHIPILRQTVNINRWNATMNMRIDILNILRICGVNIASDVQVIPVLLFNFIVWYETSILGIGCYLLIECCDDSVNITFTQTVFISVLNVPTAGINHKDALSVCSSFFINHEHAGGYAGAVKQVCRKADNTLDPVLLYNCFSNSRFGISTEQNTMRENNRSLAI